VITPGDIAHDFIETHKLPHHDNNGGTIRKETGGGRKRKKDKRVDTDQVKDKK
jgi:hypothetical protein